MTDFNYALSKYDNPLLWGNCIGHFSAAKNEGSWNHRLVHVIIGLLLLPPIFSQIGSLMELYIIASNKNISPISYKPAINSATEKTSSTLKNICQLSSEDLTTFKNVDSHELQPLIGYKTRKDFMNSANATQAWFLNWIPSISKPRPLKPVIISKSEFVPPAFVEHLMRNKKPLALGRKYENGDLITNMEGALHSFVTPICPITMTGDYRFDNGHGLIASNGKGREVILSAAIHPDFENSDESEVVMKLIEVKGDILEGKALPIDFLPLWNQSHQNHKKFKEGLSSYENQMQRHMVYHLTAAHRLPAHSEIKDKILTPSQALKSLEKLIRYKDQPLDLSASLEGFCVDLNGHVISLEALWNFYVQQVRNEFSALEHTLPQGYVYTIDPPRIFADQIGIKNVALLNRLQLLAFKHLSQSIKFDNLKAIGINNYDDKEAIDLYKIVFSDKMIVPKIELFANKGHYSFDKNYALVVHNNSDAFGQNIENEGPTSMDGVIGMFSDAACQLKSDRPDLVAHLM